MTALMMCSIRMMVMPRALSCISSLRMSSIAECERPSIDGAGTGFVLERAADAVDQRRFSGAIRPDQAEPFAGQHGEIDAVERDEAAETLAHPIDLEQRLGHHRSFARRRCCTSPTSPF